LVDSGQLNLRQKTYAKDFSRIDDKCECSTCQRYTRAYLHSIASIEAVACNLLTVHNVAYQLRLMRTIRENIAAGTFVQFIYNFMDTMYPDKKFPEWAVDALKAVGVDLKDRSSEK
jgi:queuine tRNA-ribosyltransferase catalytic subunit